MTPTCPTCGHPLPDQPRRDPPLAPLAWAEFRPDHKGKFDEMVARFADGMVHMETLDKDACYVGFYWDDGRYCQLWFGAKNKKLWFNHEHGEGEPPRFTAQGVDRRPDLPDYASTARDVVDGREGGR